ncbi:MAG: MBL fold metallo-hydrolase [Flexilinea sp.]
MYELVKVGERSYYINCPVKIGIYQQNDHEVYLIDSGNDKEAGKKVLKILEQNNWRLLAIINTHSNADHIGGNYFLQQNTGCKIFANDIEAAFTNHPILESSFLYGGYPCGDLRHKFLLAAESDAFDISDESFPKEIEVIPLPGHFFQMIGLRTPDDVVFLADCISSENTLNKYRIPFIYDVARYLETLKMVETMQAAAFIPAHAEVTDDIRNLVRINRENVYEIAEEIMKNCEEPVIFESILQKIFTTYHLSINFEQYVLVGSTIRSYLSWLKDSEKLNISFIENQLLWETNR